MSVAPASIALHTSSSTIADSLGRAQAARRRDDSCADSRRMAVVGCAALSAASSGLGAQASLGACAALGAGEVCAAKCAPGQELVHDDGGAPAVLPRFRSSTLDG